MKFISKLQFFLLFLLAFSCAQHPVQEDQKLTQANQQLTQEQINEINEKAAKKVSKRLQDLSIAAKKAGPDKIKFLASDMYLKASAALMEGDYYTANIIFKHLIDLVPDDHFIKQKYAVSLIRTGDLEESEKLLAELFEASGKKDPKVGLVLAGVHSSLGNVDVARGIYRRVIAKNPHNEEACIFLAKSYAVEDKIKTAVNLLKKCSARNKSKAIFDYYIGKIYVEKEQYKTAKGFFQKALKREPNFSLAVIALGVITEEQGDNLKALAIYKKHLKRNPNDTIVLTRAVQLLFSEGKYQEVIEYAERLSDYEPDNLNLKVKLGILYKDTKQFDKAIKAFKELLVFAPDNDKILYYLGSIFQEVTKYEDAIVYFGKIPETSGLYQDSSFQIAQMLSLLAKDEFYKKNEKGEQHDRFITYIDSKIKEIAPFKVEFSIVKAVYFEGLQDNDEAIDVLEVVREEKSFENEHRFYLASLFEKEQEYAKATELVEEIIEYEPQNAHAWNFLGYSLLERGEKLEEAFGYIKKAVDLSPEDGYIRDSLGWYYYKTGNLKEALKEIQNAVNKEPNDVAINKHMAIIYSSMKEFNKAKEYIVKALKIVQTDQERQELTEALQQLEQNRIPASFITKD